MGEVEEKAKGGRIVLLIEMRKKAGYKFITTWELHVNKEDRNDDDPIIAYTTMNT